MLLDLIIVLILSISLIFGIMNGRLPELSCAAVAGAKAAVTLCLSMCGMVCLWSGLMELMQQSGLSDKLSKLLRPLLGRLFPSASRDRDTMNSLSANVSANLLGLGNAATPAGIDAAKGLQRLSGKSSASNELCLLVVMNTASIQLIPTTVASLRSALGSSAPFEILPAVWLSSLLSVTAGIAAASLFRRFSRA